MVDFPRSRGIERAGIQAQVFLPYHHTTTIFKKKKKKTLKIIKIYS